MSKRAPYTFAKPDAGAPKYWRSLEERAKSGDPTRLKELSAEFPAGHTAMPPSEEAVALGRRGFMTVVGAALALAGAEGCRRPIEKVIPYAKMPEEVIPGIASHYATVYNRRGEALGLLVESHEGRPTKIEGNPRHPSSQGAADLIAQASVLDVYDPDRSTSPSRKGRTDELEKELLETVRRTIEGEKEMIEAHHTLGPEEYAAKVDEQLKRAQGAPEFAERKVAATWKAFQDALSEQLRKHDRDRGEGLRFLMAPTNSPTVIRMREAVLARYPAARFHWWAPVNESNVREGARLAFGFPCNTVYAYGEAEIVLSLDSDFLQTEPGAIAATKGYAARRRLPHSSRRGSMNRLYVVEPSLTTTGSNADHRLRLAATDIERFAMALSAKLLESRAMALPELAPALGNQALPAGVSQAWLDALAKDLAASRGKVIVVAGSRQPATVHALVHALNEALGQPQVTFKRVPVADPDEVAPGTPADRPTAVLDLRPLVDRLSSQLVETLIILGGNPAYDAPADLKFVDALAKARFSVHMSDHLDETGERCTWSVPRAHELEAWGDQVSLDGRRSIQQPLIQPLHGGWSDIQLLAAFANIDQKPYDLVRATARAWQIKSRTVPGLAGVEVRDVDVDKEWKSAVRDGVFPPRGGGEAQFRFIPASVAQALARRGALPESPTKDKLEVTFAPCIKMLDGRHANNAWLLEMPDPITKIVWDNVALISQATAKALGIASGDNLKLTLGTRVTYFAAWVMPGQADNSIGLTLGWGRKKGGRLANPPNGAPPMRGFDAYPLRATDAMWFTTGVKPAKFGDKYVIGQTQDHNMMEGRPIALETTYEKYKREPNFAEMQQPPPRKLPLWTDQDYVLDTGRAKGPQWGMTIDLNACTGCNACVIACQSENNVPVVGKTEVARGREMHWLRIDRYFVEQPARDVEHEKVLMQTPFEDPLVSFQPLACVQCEEAPCENVCPVNATVHSSEGLNEMAYNRCIGTRYCANNCPYKVRRFNYLNWHNDGVWTFSEPFPETLHMQQNPNVTVRFRGVMEKCTYCVQRIQEVKIAAKREGREDKDGFVDLRDGEIATACQQTCPADAIVFGDLNKKGSRVSMLANLDRRYKLLGDIGTKPRTTYLGKVRNPNPDIAMATAKSNKEKG